MSAIFGPRGGQPGPAPDRRRRVLLPTLVTLALLIFAASVFVSVETDRLWFASVGYQGVFTKTLLTRVGMFVFFGLLFAACLGFNVWFAHHHRPEPIGLRRDDPAARYRYALTPVGRPALIVVASVAGLFAGLVAQGRWQVFQLWLHRTPFGTADSHFGRDIGFFTFTYPWLRYLQSFGFVMVIVTLLFVVFVHYVFGGIVLTGGRGVSFTPTAQAQVAVLIGVAILIRAVGYWLDRYGLAIDTSGLFDGITYTDAHARIPAKNILMVVAVISAILFFSTLVFRSWLLPGIGFGLLVLTSVLIGAVWPAIMQQFQVNPSEPDREGQYLKLNIVATRKAYGVSNVDVKDFRATTNVSKSQLSKLAETKVSSRILDPTIVSQAFEQLQQKCGYYRIPSTLDVDRYVLPGSTQAQDVIIAARELDLNGLESSQRTWSNDHTVYTHGYGVIAAKGNQRGSQGEPVWVASNIPQTGDIKFTVTPRIYYGEDSPEYSLVGREKGTGSVEIDEPRCNSNSDSSAAKNSSVNTYAGTGGVKIGSLFRQSLYALKFADPKIVLSDRVNSKTKILYDRNPSKMVHKIAPWLTLDGDVYPAVVNGRVVWIVDGYTTTDKYPNSQHVSLRDATSDTLTKTNAQTMLPSDQVNYMRNSVKAVVDAYDGSVKLYQWDTSDPILKTWMKVYPGVVKPKSSISEALLAHLRYPQDEYKVQRDILARYHVTDAQTFYQDSERWKIPEDPNSSTGTTQPPYYLSLARPGQPQTQFALSSVYLPNKRQNLAAFMSVNSDATSSNYGKLQILSLSSDSATVPGPSQMFTQFSTDKSVTADLYQYQNSKNNRVLWGNLLTLPVVANGADSGSLMYVQPVYIKRSSGSGSYPVLQFVVASFGDDVGIGQSLDQAVSVALGQTGSSGSSGGSSSGSQSTPEQLLSQASEAYKRALASLKGGDLAGYQQNISKMATLLEEAQKALASQDSSSTKATPTPSATKKK